MSIRRSSIAVALATCAAITAVGGVASAASPVLTATIAAGSAELDLATSLAPDGSFRATPGAAGSVDPAAWTLVSDPVRGEAPRFARRAARPTGADGPATVPVFNDTIWTVAIKGTDVYVGGFFTDLGGNPRADYIARWDGTGWRALGSRDGGAQGALSQRVTQIEVGPDGQVYVAGLFRDAGDVPTADFIARWDGSAWHGVGHDPSNKREGAIQSAVTDLAFAKGNLYVVGWFENAFGDERADHIARFDGTRWRPVGSNAAGTDGVFNDDVWSVAASGTDVYVGGAFTDAAGKARADHVAHWDGTAWLPMGSGAGGKGAAIRGDVYTLAIVGSDVYVAGAFTDAAGIPQADTIARWTGTRWRALGKSEDGTDGALQGSITDLFVDHGTLLIAGEFGPVAGMLDGRNLIRWTGTGWVTFGFGVTEQQGVIDGRANGVAVRNGLMVVVGNMWDVNGLPNTSQIARCQDGVWSAFP